MIPPEILEKYGLSENAASGAVEAAISRVLSGAFGREILACLDSSLGVSTWPNFEEGDLVQLAPASFSRQLRRQLRYQVERELERLQSLQEWEILRHLHGQVIPGEIIRIGRGGEVVAEMIMEESFRRFVLTGECPLRAQPPRERALYRPGQVRQFLVTSVLPVQIRGKARVRVLLSRASKALPETMLREKSGQGNISCRRRIAGAFSEIETSSKLPREVIQAVGKELGERIRVRVLAPKEG